MDDELKTALLTLKKQRDNLINEKIYFLADFINLYFLYSAKFKFNKNLDNAIESMFNNFEILLTEAGYVHDIYDAIITYFESLKDLSEFSDDFINTLDDLFERVTYFGESRLIYYECIISFYHEIFDAGILTSSNYEYPEYESAMTAKERDKLLALIPEVQ